MGRGCRSRDERRRVRFSAEAGGAGAFEAAGAAGRAAAGVTTRESAAARRILHALRISADRGGACLDSGSEPADSESGGDGFDLLAAGRERDGKRVVRAGDPSPVAEAGAAVWCSDMRLPSGSGSRTRTIPGPARGI